MNQPVDKVRQAEHKLQGTCLDCGRQTIFGRWRNIPSFKMPIAKKYCLTHYVEHYNDDE